ncbi:MAG: hypothetical protein ACQESG_01855 [Nanobdellota archaeon]
MAQDESERSEHAAWLEEERGRQAQITRQQQQITDAQRAAMARYANTGSTSRFGNMPRAAWAGMGAAGGAAASAMWQGGEAHPSKSDEPFWPLLLSFLLLLSDFFVTKFDGINWEEFSFFVAQDPLDVIWHLGNGVIITIFLFYAITHLRDVRSWIPFLLLEIAFYFIAMYSGFNAGALLHILFILYLYFFYVKPRAVDQVQGQFMLLAFIIIDFFVISAVSDLTSFPMRMLPVWFIATLIFTTDMKRGAGSKVLIFLVLALYVFGFAAELGGFKNMASYLDSSETNDFIDFITQSYENAMASWGVLKNTTQNIYNRSTAVYREEYYTGKIDKNAQMELGVELEDIEVGHTEQFVDEPVNLWTTVKVQTLDTENITVRTWCIANEGEEDERVADELRPTQFMAHDYGVFPIDCTFHSNTYKPGSHEFQIGTSFNFRTEAYQKIYFMDRTKYSALRTQDEEPLEYYGIDDTEPETIYTNGPIMIGISLRDNLIQLDKRETQLMLGVTFTNNWNGKVTSVDSVRITFPSAVHLDGNCSGEYQFTCAGTDPIECTLIDEIPPFKKRQTLRCPIRIAESNIDNVLGESPLSIRFFRAGIEYNYSITEHASVRFVKSKEMAELEEKTKATKPTIQIPHLFINEDETVMINLHNDALSGDEETNDVYLYYDITDHCDYADCSIYDNKYLNCTGKSNGTCTMDISVNDLAHTTHQDMQITVGAGSCRWDDAHCIQQLEKKTNTDDTNDTNDTNDTDPTEITNTKPLEFTITGYSSATGTQIYLPNYFEKGDELRYTIPSSGPIGHTQVAANKYSFYMNNQYVECTEDYNLTITVTGDNSKAFDLSFRIVDGDCETDCRQCTRQCCEYSSQSCHYSEKQGECI